MPRFTIRTEEYWLHRVEYTVSADTVDKAMQKMLRGEVEYDHAEVIEGADEVQQINTLDGQSVTDLESDKLLAKHKARRRWQRDRCGKEST